MIPNNHLWFTRHPSQIQFWLPTIGLLTFRQPFKIVLTFLWINKTNSPLFLMIFPSCLMENSDTGTYPDEEIHLDINPPIRPHRCCAYPVPCSQLNHFKEELDCLVGISVLSPTGCSTWISGSFIIPKKDNTVRWISDFQALNKAYAAKYIQSLAFKISYLDALDSLF